MSRNPFMLEGDEWKEKRAEISPAFTSSRVILKFLMFNSKLFFINNLSDTSSFSTY